MTAERITQLTLESASAEATQAAGHFLGERLEANSVLALRGDLGAGKTTFARGLGAGLGIEEGIASPSYTLMQAHEGGRLPLYHFDAWMEGREKALFLDGGDEWLEAGGVALIEWAGRVEEWLPEPRLAIQLDHLDPQRRRIQITVVGASQTLETLLGELQGALLDLPGLTSISGTEG